MRTIPLAAACAAALAVAACAATAATPASSALASSGAAHVRSAAAPGQVPASPGISADLLRPSAHPVPLQDDNKPLNVTYTYDGTKHTLNDYLQRSGTEGFVVLDGQKVVNEQYLGASPSTRFQSWSMAKSFTSAAVGIALGEGRIHSIDDPVTRYLPELRGSGYNGVSIRNVLRMSSGIDWNEGKDAPRLQAAANAGLDLTKMAARQVRGWQPGSKFNYTSMNYFVLAWLVSKVTGTPYYRYIETKLWQPAGMGAAAYVANDTHGDNLGYCCYYATERDFARFGLLYLRNGAANGHQVVPGAWVSQSTRPSSAFAPGYGLGWWLGDGDAGDFMAVGFGGQYIYVSPKDNVVIADSTGKGIGARQMQQESLTAFRAVAATVAGTGAGTE